MNLKQKIASKQLVVGTWVTLGHGAIGEIFARAGSDWVTIDLEHSVIDLSAAQELIRAVDLCGSAPLVRLSSIDAVQIKRVMDAGAHGVIAPNVKSRADAEAVVQALHYPPTGTRGVGLARAQKYGAGFKDYVRWLSESAVAMIQIEHIDAIANLELIFTTPGIDGFLIGPYDLSASLGKPGDFANPEFISAMNEIKTIAKKVGMPSGIHVVEPDAEAFNKARQEGFKIIAYSVDMRILDAAIRTMFTEL